jgi:hypothetical protein
MPKPVVQPLDQTTQSVLVTNVYGGAQLALNVGATALPAVAVEHIILDWRLSGNAKFGDLEDGQHVVLQGRFTASGKDEILFYYAGDGTWWLGVFVESRITWNALSINRFGDLNDGNHRLWTGNFTGDSRTEVLFYYNGDNRWWLGRVTPDGLTLTWKNVSTTGFGNLLDGQHSLWVGNFGGTGRDEIVFYYAGDGHTWHGRIDDAGTTLSWNGPLNTSPFGNLADSNNHRTWLGAFSKTSKTQVLFYYSGDNRWWLGTLSDDARSFSWTQVAQTGFGNLLDGNHTFWSGNFVGAAPAGRDQLLFYYATDGHFFLGQVSDNGAAMLWSPPLTTARFGNLADSGHAVWQGDFSGQGNQELLFYYSGDNRWWHGTVAANGITMSWSIVAQTGFGNLLAGSHSLFRGRFGGGATDAIAFYYNGDGNWWAAWLKAGKLDWYRPANTRGFGNLLDGAHQFLQGDFDGLGKDEMLFYDRDDGNWWLGLFDGVRVSLPESLQPEPGTIVTAAQSRGDLRVRDQHRQISDTVTVDHNYATQHYDRARTGWNFREKKLTPQNATNLRPLFPPIRTDDQLYAQPLYVQKVMLPGERTARNLVFLATENDSVYAFDADTGNAIWHTRVLPTGHTPVPSEDCYGDGARNIAPNIGITGTPVIDRPSNTIFTVAKTKDLFGGHHQYVYALDLRTGSIHPDSPSEITFPFFDARANNNRAALLLSRDTVYIAFGSYGDQHADRYHGWVVSFDAATLNRLSVFNSGPQGQCGVWQSGVGLAADVDGNVFFTTGNGPADRPYGNSVIRLNPDLSLGETFSPAHQEVLNSNDWDLGSGAVMLVPLSTVDSTQLLVTGGKQGYMYVLAAHALGGREAEPDQRRFVLYGKKLYGQDWVSQAPGQPVGSDKNQPGMFGGPAFLNDAHDGQFVFVVGHAGPPGNLGQLIQFRLTGSALDPLAKSSHSFLQGATPFVTSNGSQPGTAVVWLLDRTSPLQLFAYDASASSMSLPAPLFSRAVGIWRNGAGQPFLQATVIDGRVFAPYSDGVVVFGP